MIKCKTARDFLIAGKEFTSSLCLQKLQYIDFNFKLSWEYDSICGIECIISGKFLGFTPKTEFKKIFQITKPEEGCIEYIRRFEKYLMAL